MFNKIELVNNGNPFIVKFNGTEHTVPSGLFEAEQTLGNFIFNQARKWNLDVTIDKRPEAPSVKKITESSIKVVKEPTVEEVEENQEEEEKLSNKKKK